MSEDPRFAATEFVVEATHFEVLTLWGHHADDETARRYNGGDLYGPRYSWIQDGMGQMVQVGELAGHPVCFTAMWDTVGGVRVLFWESSSRVVDYDLIRKWLEKNCAPKWDRGTRLAHTNAMNFHHVLNHIQDKRGKR